MQFSDNNCKIGKVNHVTWQAERRKSCPRESAPGQPNNRNKTTGWLEYDEDSGIYIKMWENVPTKL